MGRNINNRDGWFLAYYTGENLHWPTHTHPRRPKLKKAHRQHISEGLKRFYAQKREKNGLRKLQE